MEMGNQSAALVEVNGITRRVQVGEPIGTKGWKLLNVGNQEAVVQRNQDVSTIQVGQQF
jgi:Tfp pilus assembly protein PilP